MKKVLLRLLPVFIVSFVLSFMMIIYEPTLLFISSSEDFWFTFGMMLKMNIVLFLIAFILLSLFGIGLYYLGKKINKEWIINIYLILLSSGFLFFYIQGNYFSSKLPILDGSPIEWGSFKLESIISVLLVIFALGLNIVLYKKKKDIYNKIVSYIAVIIFVLLLTGLIPSIIKNKSALNSTVKCTSSLENINKLSSNKNFLILVVDMLDSRTFAKVLKEENKEDLFKDFTYYPDTLSAYSYTRESIPFMMSGKWYELDGEYSDYYNDSFDNSPLLKRLRKEDYDINIYEQDMQWTSKKCLDVNNMNMSSYKVSLFSFAKQESKYLIFKYFPYPLKRFSKILTMNFNSIRENTFEADNKVVFNTLDDIELQDNNYFQFIHIDGGHYPWNMDENFNIVENSTYEDKIKASIKVIDKYLTRIKDSGQYDNTAIIVLADHGTNGWEYTGRQNPSLYIKGINEHHDSMIISDKKVSQVDLVDSIYNDLLDGKTSEELLKNIGTDRVRRHLWYKDMTYDKYFEQTTDGNAWDTDNLKNTGTIYERK